jgi:hypothetical protein
MSATVVCITPQGHEIHTDIASLLTPELRETARREANLWIKRLRLVRYGGEPMRDRFLYRGDSLWWFTELYLHKMRKLDRAVSVTLALDAARERHGAVRLSVDTADLVTRDAAHAFGRARGIPVETRGREIERRRHAWPSYLVGLTATLSRLRPSRPTPRPKPAVVAAFVHSAFWRAEATGDGPGQESYIGPVLDAVASRLSPGDLSCVGLGPRRNFRARKWWDPVLGSSAVHELVTPIERLAPRERLASALELWRRRSTLAEEITTGEEIRAAGEFRGCDLWQVLRRELEAVALLQWPWSARAMDEAASAIDALSPEVVLTYAEAGGWGRALVLEARRRGVRSVGVQHGFIYRHWLNYLHEPDELIPSGSDRGAPIPDRTLVFDRYALGHLCSAGHFPDDAVRVTGNARLDELAGRFTRHVANRDAIRRELGATPDGRVVVLAAKFSEIRQQIPDIVQAVEGLPQVRLVIKVHPAETADVYADAVRGARQTSIAAASVDLARLLSAADVIVTMNSTVAIDGLVLGLPALVVGLPNNLSPFVETGVMAGAEGVTELRHGLKSVLYDREAREALARAADDFIRRFDIRADGHAAERAADEILGMTTGK